MGSIVCTLSSRYLLVFLNTATPARIPASSTPILTQLALSIASGGGDAHHASGRYISRSPRCTARSLSLSFARRRRAHGNVWSNDHCKPAHGWHTEALTSRARKSNLPVALDSSIRFPHAFLASDMPRERVFDSEADLGLQSACYGLGVIPRRE
ncbi:hypothetical protein C8F01DRAFT_449823 [Mycena amicta]|nr:hypothetical protein C8F01DRAFT_449823 [Mycena amicta]